MGTERTVLVLRHAKSAYPPGVLDPERPLSDRGRRNAAAAGDWLRGRDLLPDRVLCSPSARTRETWDLVSAHLGWTGTDDQVIFDPRLYDADPDDLLQVIRQVPATVGMLALIGHNPASQELVADLTGQPGIEFPTAALAVIRLRGPGWPAAAWGAGRLSAYWTPKGGSVPARS
ncbi:MAG TPA: histidine phosphatase family protein [Streptosporangiaceae bacterium]|jgi:phosphohistidine phosphatase|nr:histidine phosphatase family protein [Streptosporangiaceae bacterium]